MNGLVMGAAEARRDIHLRGTTQGSVKLLTGCILSRGYDYVPTMT